MTLSRAVTVDNNARIIVLAGGMVLALSFGVRSIFGGVVQPISDDLFAGSIDVFSLSIALQNLIWGLAQPAFGMVADKYGDRRALWLGFCCYVLGMSVTILGTSAFSQHLGAGVLVGMGISGTAFGVVLAAVGRAAPEEKRTFYLGVTSALGSTGQAVLPLVVAWLITWLDWRLTLAAVTGILACMALCIPMLTKNTCTVASANNTLDITTTVQRAFRYPSYVLLCFGFFVCGFHLAFITAHLPNFVQNFCVSPASATELRALGLQALALAGLANIGGTLAAAWIGDRVPKPFVLSMIYALRACIILAFIALPVTPTSVMVFALLMGVLWLSTVPLTSALALVMFGPRAMGTLFGFVFLSHQLGSFVGVWLGGLMFSRYASYDHMWYLAIALAILSSVAHLLVEEREAPPDYCAERS